MTTSANAGERSTAESTRLSSAGEDKSQKNFGAPLDQSPRAAIVTAP
jgi:hypothetical protein